MKNIDAVYQTNSRGADWVKVKPEYSDQMGENLDLLVLGGWWGKGGRTGKISSLLCGLRVPQDDDGSGETPECVLSHLRYRADRQVQHVCECRVRDELRGLRMDAVSELLRRDNGLTRSTNHKKHWKPFDRARPPPWMKCGPVGVDDKRASTRRPHLLR